MIFKLFVKIKTFSPQLFNILSNISFFNIQNQLAKILILFLEKPGSTNDNMLCDRLNESTSFLFFKKKF